MTTTQARRSPKWSRNVKLVIMLVFVVILGALIMRFHTLLGPVLFSFFVAYLLHPVVSFVDKKIIHSWRASVSVFYLLFIIILVSMLTWGGLNLLQQVQSMITLIESSITQLPELINDLFSSVYQIGPFSIDFTAMNLTSIGQDILGVVQPMLGNLGNIVSDLATSAAGTFGWMAFILIVSYFFLLESGGLRTRIIHVDIPDYSEDISRISSALSRIWNAFIRGQFIIFILTAITYSIVFPILGVRYALGLALLGATATFLPYIGPAVTWIAIGMVTYFQSYKPWDLTPLTYTAIVIGIALLIDQIFNNLIIPRILSKALKVHPAAVLISAVIAANLLGLIGLLVAAPLLATITLLGKYILRKMLDRDPWPDNETEPPPKDTVSIGERLSHWWKTISSRFGKKKA